MYQPLGKDEFGWLIQDALAYSNECSSCWFYFCMSLLLTRSESRLCVLWGAGRMGPARAGQSAWQTAKARCKRPSRVSLSLSLTLETIPRSPTATTSSTLFRLVFRCPVNHTPFLNLTARLYKSHLCGGPPFSILKGKKNDVIFVHRTALCQ